MNKKFLTSLLAAIFALAFHINADAQTKRPKKPVRRPVAKKPMSTSTANLSSGATKTPSGLIFLLTKKGTGAKATTGDTVSVHYTGTLTDGTKFDSSHDRDEPISFPLGQGRVIKGWDEGIAMMHVGDQAILVIPPSIGYGSSGQGPIPPDSTLIFVVELVNTSRKMFQ
jgi:peptidylprolyl isomerase